MSHSNGNQSTPAGWHADPSGAPQQRWWDGTRWTEHTQATPQAQQHQAQQPTHTPQLAQSQQQSQPQYAQQPQQYGQQQYGQQQYGQQQQHPAYSPVYATQAPPPVAPGTPVYNVFIWVLTVLPVLSLLILPLYSSAIEQSVTTTYRYGGSMSFLGLQAVGSLVSLVLYAAIVVLAYFDHKWLVRQGYVQPFHWAWAFLSIVYPIGRSVVVRRRSGRGIAPMWVSIGLCVLSIIVSSIWTFSLIATIFGTSMTYGSYT